MIAKPWTACRPQRFQLGRCGGVTRLRRDDPHLPGRSAPVTVVDHSDSRRALIIGGSLGGLFAGNPPGRIGWDVEIFERSAKDLDSRGGGIVLQPTPR